ncbi:MAG: DegT/DnrJ/EryC1/StrS family aminotransferase [Pirellulales bacterium]|nr:DegT/DnrJ/EryC1/StrS family aminotransferase [Pirellulales bacterium]
MSQIYSRLGVRTVINGAGTLTRLGGSLMEPEVVAAMAEASRSFVRIDELQVAVGRRIAEATGAEAGLVTSGAAAAVTLAAAACLARLDFARMDRLPDTRGLPNEIIVARSHRNGYDHALRAAGARIVEVGVAERTRDPQPWEIEAAIHDRTVAVAFAAGFSDLRLDEVVRVAERHSLPVIVDASAELPPRSNLRTFIAAGASLVAFSGGKGLRGPQASGILCGRRELIASAALQMWDMDHLPALWNPPAELVDRDVVTRGVPNHGLGRAMKIGKEEIVGLAVALERFLARDEAGERERLDQVAVELAAGLKRITALDVSLVEHAGRWRQVRLQFPDQPDRQTAIVVARELAQGSPAIYLADAGAQAGVLVIDPFCLQPGDAQAIVARLDELLGA